MSEINMNNEHNTQAGTPVEENVSRRSLLRGAGVMTGLVLSGALLGKARAQDTGTGGMTGGGTMGGTGTTSDTGTTGGTGTTDGTGSDMGTTGGATTGGSMTGGAMKNDMMSGIRGDRGMMGIPKGGIIKPTSKPGKAEANDVAILNFALTLEYLESEFYTLVVRADEAHPFLKGRVKDVARILMRDENTHVQTVSDAVRALGGTPVPKPTFQFPGAAFVSQIGFLQASEMFEETGVSAYLGQAPRVQRKDVLNFAASIYGNEARHTGLIRFLLGDSIAARDEEMPLNMGQILTRIRPFVISLNMDNAGAMGGTGTMDSSGTGTTGTGTMGTTP